MGVPSHRVQKDYPLEKPLTWIKFQYIMILLINNINNTGKIPEKGQIPVLKYYMMVILGLQKVVQNTIQFIVRFYKVFFGFKHINFLFLFDVIWKYWRGSFYHALFKGKIQEHFSKILNFIQVCLKITIKFPLENRRKYNLRS